MAISHRGDIWTVTAGDLSATINPKAGGKIERLTSARSGRNFFFLDPRPALSSPGTTEYLRHNISGCDECFPTVGRADATYGQDHGVLWNAVWSCSAEPGRLVTAVGRPLGMPVAVQRTVAPAGSNALRLEYLFRNLSSEPIPFIYSSHPILAPSADSRVRLPGVRRLSVLGHNGVLAAGQRQSWPRARTRAGATVRLDTGFCEGRALAGKWFAPGTGKAEVTFPDAGEKLTLTWDRKNLPYLGVWLSLGIPLDPRHPDPAAWNCLALEPCTTPHDVLGAVSRQPVLPAGGAFGFWMQWHLSPGAGR